jgi:hypothetical protein
MLLIADLLLMAQQSRAVRYATLLTMLYMVIEHLAPEKMNAMADRFHQQGRLLPEGVAYKTSWIDERGTRCYQVMEAENRALLDQWIARWNDLVDFEVVRVVTSAEFWARREKPGAQTD